MNTSASPSGTERPDDDPAVAADSRATADNTDENSAPKEPTTAETNTTPGAGSEQSTASASAQREEPLATTATLDTLPEAVPADTGSLGAANEAEPTQPATPNPSLSELLRSAAQGDQPAFSAFYESTSDVVYGMALLMHASTEDAQASTVAVYDHLWYQADARARDLRLHHQSWQSITQTYSVESSEYELVLEWLIPLAHRIFVERFRDGSATAIELTPVDRGGSIAGLPEEIIDDLLALSDSQAQALALGYLAGLSYQGIAERVGAAIPSVKSRIRDAIARLHSKRSRNSSPRDPILRAAVTPADISRGSAVNRNFTTQISADLDKGLLVELAELYAADALSDEERFLLDEQALTADPETAQQWELRVLAARRTLAEIFAKDPVAPPSQLLTEVLSRVSDQGVGVSLVENVSNHVAESERRTPVMKRWMYGAILAVVLVIGLSVLIAMNTGPDLESLAENDPEAVVVEDQALAEGGSLNAVLSQDQDAGYVEFNDLPALEGDETYQVWLIQRDASDPSSLGNFSADELNEDGIGVPSLENYSGLSVSIEQIRNEERPTGTTVAHLDFPQP